ncbi:hypothetical protein [Hyphomonas sp.]|uniref:hypothetical protein n=1 Tax=Hyphomonas sp. TaxID=87 RepID=UPI00391CF7CF
MSVDQWQHRAQIALAGFERDLERLAADIAAFGMSLSPVEQAMVAGIALLMMFYLVLPAASETSQGNGRAFTGLLLIIVATGLSASWLVSGRITI